MGVGEERHMELSLLRCTRSGELGCGEQTGGPYLSPLQIRSILSWFLLVFLAQEIPSKQNNSKL